MITGGSAVDLSAIKANPAVKAIVWVGYPGQAGGWSPTFNFPNQAPDFIQHLPLNNPRFETCGCGARSPNAFLSLRSTRIIYLGGAAIAAALSGATNKWGRLPMTWYDEGFCAAANLTGERKRFFLRHFIAIEIKHLPRQARDRHRGTLKKRMSMFFLHRLSYEARPEHELSRSHPQVLHRRGCLQIRRGSLLHHIPLQPAAESSPHRLDSFIGKAGRHNRDDAVREHDQHGAENTAGGPPFASVFL